MLGMGDFQIFSAYSLCILATLTCIIYGIVNWNKGDASEAETKKEADWEKKDIEISENLDV